MFMDKLGLGSEQDKNKRAYRPFFRNSVAIGGSYRDDNGRFDEFKRIYYRFNELGINIVHPFSLERLNKDDEFVRLEGDEKFNLSNEELQQDANTRISDATAAYFVCPDGYLGQHTEAEVYELTGEAEYEDVAIYFSEPPDPWPGSDIRDFIQEIAIGRVKTPEYVATVILNNTLDYLRLPEPNDIHAPQFR